MIQRGRIARSKALRKVSRGGTVRPFLMSMWRWPRIGRSTVTNSAEQFAALRPLDHRFAEAAVAEHVELVPERLRGRFAHVLDGADRHGGEAEPRAGGLRGARALHLAVAREQVRPCRSARSRPAAHSSRRAGWSRPKSARRRPARAGASGWRRGRRGWRAASARHRSRARHSRTARAAGAAARSGAGPRHW